MTFPMPLAPRLNADFLWECPGCHRPYRNPQRAADCACPAKKPPTVVAPLVRCSELPMFDGHFLALTELAGSRPGCHFSKWMRIYQS